MSEELVKNLLSFGAEKICATPHFYFYKEEVSSFLKRRDSAYKKIENISGLPEIILGAEVALEHGLSDVEDVSKLAIEGTDYILLELPRSGFEKWIIHEIENIMYEHHLIPIFAHIERYANFLSVKNLYSLFEIKEAIFQVNVFAMNNFFSRVILRKLYNCVGSESIILGSDLHRYDARLANTKSGLLHVSKMFSEQDFEKIRHGFMG